MVVELKITECCCFLSIPQFILPGLWVRALATSKGPGACPTGLAGLITDRAYKVGNISNSVIPSCPQTLGFL